MPSARDGLDIGSTASRFLWRALPADARCVAMIRQGESAATNAAHGILAAATPLKPKHGWLEWATHLLRVGEVRGCLSYASLTAGVCSASPCASSSDCSDTFFSETCSTRAQ